MCGICGGMGRIDPKIIESLLIANEERGDQSTGIAYRDGSGKPKVLKQAKRAQQFVVDNDMSKVLAGATQVIGHCRWATHGAVTDENAHPITVGKVTGVHNGVISNHATIPHGGVVDSQAIFHCINEALERPWEAFSRLSGSCSAAWMVEGDARLHLVKSTNPLHVAILANVMYFSSEYYPLLTILHTAGIEAVDDVDHIDNTHAVILEVQEDNMLSVTNKRGFPFQSRAIKMLVETVGKFTSYSHGGQVRNNRDAYELQDWERQLDGGDTRWENEEEIDEGELANDNPSLIEYYRSLKPQDACYDLATEEGCCVCGQPGKAGDNYYLDPKHMYAYCQSCAIEMSQSQVLSSYIL